MGKLKVKNAKINGQFLALPYSMLSHPNYAKLSTRAVKMLVDIGGQFNGINNGDLVTTASYLKKVGWNSNDQISKAKKELLTGGWIVETRKGSRNKIPSLYAITWRAIDECNGKLDRPATTNPLAWWTIGHNPEEKLDSDPRHTVQTEPPHGALATKKGNSLHRNTVHLGHKTPSHRTATR
jgi:hypothetical protein